MSVPPRFRQLPRTVLAVLLAASLAAVSGCGTLPDDHALGTTIGASLHRFEGSLRDTVAGLDHEVRTGLQDTSRAVVGLPDAVVRRTDRLQHSTRDLVGGSIARAEIAPLRIRDATLAGVRAETARGAGLTRTLAPSAVGTQLERSLVRFEHEVLDLPATLRLDRPFLPTPTDPNAGAEPIPAGRSPSLFERVLRQIPW